MFLKKPCFRYDKEIKSLSPNDFHPLKFYVNVAAQTFEREDHTTLDRGYKFNQIIRNYLSKKSHSRKNIPKNLNWHEIDWFSISMAREFENYGH